LAPRSSYEVVTTTPASQRYKEDVLKYLVKYFTISRATEIDTAIIEFAASLSKSPSRGTREPYLSHKEQDFRFILFKEGNSIEIKIIYFIDEDLMTVYITDFFPTKMNPHTIRG